MVEEDKIMEIKPEQEIQKLRELLSQREVELLLLNPKEFNRFLLRQNLELQESQSEILLEVLKLKEGINSLIDLANENSGESEPNSKYDDEIEQKKEELRKLEKKKK